MDESFLNRAGDRRGRRRYKLELMVWFCLIDSREQMQQFEGTTINIGVEGVLIAAPGVAQLEFSVGQRIKVAIGWPLLTEDEYNNLKLVAEGRIVRSEHDQIAVALETKEFHLNGMPLALLI